MDEGLSARSLQHRVSLGHSSNIGKYDLTYYQSQYRLRWKLQRQRFQAHRRLPSRQCRCYAHFDSKQGRVQWKGRR
jgi:hypothetical protein